MTLALLFPTLLRQPSSDPAWVDVQLWARDHTPQDALFLTPARQGGFRIPAPNAPSSANGRDGTQLYFSALFTKPGGIA